MNSLTTITFFSIIIIFSCMYYIYNYIRSNKKRDALSNKIDRIINQRYALEKIRQKKPEKYISVMRATEIKKQKTRTYLLITHIIIGLLAGLIYQDLSSIFTITTLYTISFLVSSIFFKNKISKLQKRFILDFPDVLDLMARSILSGHSISDAIKIVSENSSGILAEEFTNIKNNLALGSSLQDALELAGKQIKLSDFHYFIVITYVQQTTGGNIAILLQNLANSLRKKIAMQKKIKALASEPVASATVIGMIPIGIGMMISMLNPQYMLPLLQDPLGQNILLGCMVWQILGVIVMRKIIRIDI